MKVKVRRAGNSLVITIPKEIVDDLDMEEGDTVRVSWQADCSNTWITATITEKEKHARPTGTATSKD